ncbi:hypothetical protein H6P81_009218 [Aristolochia fimbriata]|uniref:Uncharacterized protein n=1 Tax=Aristolochia fimbriata TaxID=158543 RepID=A0AAV7EPS0_ARIFI|nr:hypothetical protein H6P81_009218 [Aristolochia fimbriata]
MVVEDCKTTSTSVPPPPRLLNVQKFTESRASELEALYSIIADRVNNNFQSQQNKRRRTTGYDDRIARKNSMKKQKLGQKSNSSIVNDHETQLSRRSRRRKEFMRNAETGFSTSLDGTKRLRTHLWHTKSFKMVKQWGFYLPLGLQGSGRGSRSVLKWLKSGAVIHDESYSCAVQLEGPEDSLFSILRMVLVPFPLSEELSQAVLRGICYGSALLYHIGAPHSHLIAPVTYMWRPSYQEKINTEVGIFPTSSNSFRQMWVWLHAAAFDEGFNALNSACEKMMNEENVSVGCFSRGGQLAKLEVMGSKASEVLLKILHPVSEASNVSGDIGLTSCSVLKNAISSPPESKVVHLHCADSLSNSVVSLTVQDPRDLEKGNLIELAAPTSGPSSNTGESISSLWLKADIDPVELSDSKDLWTLYGQVNVPVEDSVLVQKRHEKRLAFFHLDGVTTKKLVTEGEKHSAHYCPILLLKSTIEGSSLLRWTIILPVSWIKAFWIPLIVNRAHAIGLRERRWIAISGGIPTFPYDFPDSRAYSDLMASEAVAHQQMAELRPLSVRPLKVPIPSPWDCVKLSAVEWPTTIQNAQTLDAQTFHSEPANRRLLEQEDAGTSFQGFVARTSTLLISFLNEIYGNSNSELLPDVPNEQRIFSVLLNKVRNSWVLKETRELPTERKLCFVRVHLHAYKEGAFEEGAVVCAPVHTDLSLSTSWWDEKTALQIPHSSVKSYFMQLPSGKWELQIPDNPAACQWHRWPIGFVTSGFVRGSTKPVAIALCEATLLLRLRQEQRGETKENERPEIFVLVRNLTSTAYRLALASIVLEDQEADSSFV